MTRRGLLAIVAATIVGWATIILVAWLIFVPLAAPASQPMPPCPTEDANTTAAGEDCFWHAPLGGRSFAVIDGTVIYVFGTTTTNGI